MKVNGPKNPSACSALNLKFDDSLIYRLIPGSGEEASLALPNSIKLEQDKNGAVVLDLIPRVALHL